MTTAQEYLERRWTALILLCVAQFVVVLDASIVNVALPSIGKGLGFSEQESEDLLRLLLDTLRASGAISIPELVDIRGEAFAPRRQHPGRRLGTIRSLRAVEHSRAGGRGTSVIARLHRPARAPSDSTTTADGAGDDTSRSRHGLLHRCRSHTSRRLRGDAPGRLPDL